jgi:hypothetical protein
MIWLKPAPFTHGSCGCVTSVQKLPAGLTNRDHTSAVSTRTQKTDQPPTVVCSDHDAEATEIQLR